MAMSEGMNAGLDAYVDVRLAMLLFRNVYAIEGASIITKVAKLLLETLAANPHQIEAWELLFTHVKIGSVVGDEILPDVYRILRPHASHYQHTWGQFLSVVADTYQCDSFETGVLPMSLHTRSRTGELIPSQRKPHSGPPVSLSGRWPCPLLPSQSAPHLGHGVRRRAAMALWRD